jgi:non-homologous end joining protein Ku
MAARAMWKADLALGEIKVPVKLYSAVQDSKVHFRLLHAAECLGCHAWATMQAMCQCLARRRDFAATDQRSSGV